MSRTTNLPMIAFAITLTRGFGQGALSVVSLALVGKWFGRKLNFAMGVYSLLVGIGFVCVFPAVGGIVLRSGWRTAWDGIGWTLALLVSRILADRS
jgi:MFS family permease